MAVRLPSLKYSSGSVAHSLARPTSASDLTGREALDAANVVGIKEHSSTAAPTTFQAIVMVGRDFPTVHVAVYRVDRIQGRSEFSRFWAFFSNGVCISGTKFVVSSHAGNLMHANQV